MLPENPTLIHPQSRLKVAVAFRGLQRPGLPPGSWASLGGLCRLGVLPWQTRSGSPKLLARPGGQLRGAFGPSGLEAVEGTG